jgi:hypothetical protein
VRTRHYSYRTECTYVDWVRRFFEYTARRQAAPHPRVTSEGVRDYLAHLAVRRQVSASTQNQAFCAVLFLCRDVLGVELERMSRIVAAKRGERLPEGSLVPGRGMAARVDRRSVTGAACWRGVLLRGVLDDEHRRWHRRRPLNTKEVSMMRTE